jgi:hypothetical protein
MAAPHVPEVRSESMPFSGDGSPDGMEENTQSYSGSQESMLPGCHLLRQTRKIIIE